MNNREMYFKTKIVTMALQPAVIMFLTVINLSIKSILGVLPVGFCVAYFIFATLSWEMLLPDIEADQVAYSDRSEKQKNAQLLSKISEWVRFTLAILALLITLLSVVFVISE